MIRFKASYKFLVGVGILASAASCTESGDKVTAKGGADSKTVVGFGLNEDAQNESVNPARAAMISQAQQYKNLIRSRYATLQGERDRQGKLVSELMNRGSSGCFGDVKLAKLEILINGEWLPRKHRGKSKNPRANEGGGPTTITFQFGPQMAVTNDEKTSSMFQPAGQKIVTKFAELTLNDIEYIKISKGGTLYDSERVCKKKNFGLSEKCRYNNYEEARYGLNSIELKANGETFYRAEGIGSQFDADKLEWQDNKEPTHALKVNEAYLKLMAREDCPQ